MESVWGRSCTDEGVRGGELSAAFFGRGGSRAMIRQGGEWLAVGNRMTCDAAIVSTAWADQWWGPAASGCGTQLHTTWEREKGARWLKLGG
jgi:hypothetical protein